MATGKARRFFDGTINSTLAYCTWIGDGTGILAGYGSGAIRAWSSQFKGGYRDLPRQYSTVTGLSIQLQGQLAVTNGTENRAMFLDWPNGRLVGTEAGGSYLTRFSTDGKQLAMESSNGVLRLYDVKPSPVARQYVHPEALSNGFNNSSTPIAVIRPDGRLIASIRNGAVDFFDMLNTSRLGTMKADSRSGLAWLKGGREFMLADSAGISRWSMTDNADGSINVKKISLTPVDGYMYRAP
jgi:WD40 repeat protein